MSEGISYHSKDILFKSLSELYKDEALDVFGITDSTKIKELLPNEFPKVRADERRSDTLFLMEDDSILMLEFESNNRVIENHLKYIDYGLRILNRYYDAERKIKQIRVVVIYTSDVVKADESLNAGDLTINSKAVFLHEYQGDAILEIMKEKVEAGEYLTHQELMKLSFLPLMYSRHDRQALIQECVELAKSIQDETSQLQVIAGILTATDKFIDEGYAKKVREWLKMTKVGRIFEEEKQEAVREAVREAVERRDREKAIEFAKSLLDLLAPEVIAEKTGLDIEEVERLKRC
jgi:hypothetical protein